ncbi:hypothetical protein GYMLUDRAFT_39053 [Collybiopsis luxurians FD-317 M1]|nr:hypothetical protein GYMLUDRAFT_39053 [Collybiopsis luxurians FD-317 M1]
MSDDIHVASIHALYLRLKTYPQPSQYTILAALYLTNNATSECKIISLGTGTKCLPENRLTAHGEAIHDSHAEILARRGGIRWLLEEILRERDSKSKWIERQEDSYRLRNGVELRMYISTVPCGDASTRFLAASQDPDMATLKDSAVVIPPEGATARGRNNYHLYNVLRTKPGRADSPPTLSLSCSDKIASWAWLGFQGFLCARFFLQGIYITKIIIGEVLSTDDVNLINSVAEDCKRALGGRLEGLLPDIHRGAYALHIPTIVFTSIPFVHSRTVLGFGTANTSSHESLCWWADPLSPPTLLQSEVETGTVQVIINGFKRGASPKHRQRLQDDKFLPYLCKLSMFRLYARVCKEIYNEEISSTQSYYDIKTGPGPIHYYYEAKALLKGPSGPFSDWWGRQSELPPGLTEEDQDAEELSFRSLAPQLGCWERFNIEGKVIY